MKRHLGIFIPAILGVVLFGVTVFWFILPSLENGIMSKKREMIRELTNTAWSVLASYDAQVRAGVLSRVQAEARALSRIKMMRYGPEGKDYFWVNDMTPVMIMHPYRYDLVGASLADYTDPKGKKVFAQAVEAVQKDGAGYIDYFWQWKDDPSRVALKVSYVRGFKPWGWVVGTGLYVDDVQAEVRVMTRNLTILGALVLVLVSLLSGYLALSSLRADKERRRLQAQLLKLATTDSLTGVNNRHSFWEKAEQELIRARRYGRVLSILMIDLDHFKRINDTHGHHVGDLVLKAVADACMDLLRQTDVFGRLGGEEFAALLVETSLEDAVQAAERICLRLEEMKVDVDGKSVGCTVSVGAASLAGRRENLAELIKRADKALYKAKESGRNCVQSG